jgi:hypothetical protein
MRSDTALLEESKQDWYGGSERLSRRYAFVDRA